AALGGVGADRGARESQRAAPHRAVAGRRDAIERDVHAPVLVGIERLVRLGVFAALAVAVGVEDERSPALRLHLVAGLLEHLHIDPAGSAAGRTTRARPQ